MFARRETSIARALGVAAGAALIAALLLAAGCRGSDDGARPATGGPTRPFMMGFSSLPRALNSESYGEAIDFAAENGDIVLIQRTLPWSDFIPGSGVSDETRKSTAAERDAIAGRDVSLFFAIDVTDGATGRDRLAGLPVSLQGKDFSDPDVRRAFIAYAEYVALNYKPDYLALGVEMNLYYEKNKDSFEHFETLYAQAYDAVKAKSPDTQVTVTFQYEDLQGLLPRDDPHFASWELIDAFEERLDFLAISTYPSFAFSSAAAIPDDYYRQLRAFTDKPIAIAEMGYSSAAGEGGLNSGTEAEQSLFVRRILTEAEEMDMAFAVWFAIWDPAFARDTAFAAFQNIGLRREDDGEKPAWRDWAEVAARAYEAGG